MFWLFGIRSNVFSWYQSCEKFRFASDAFLPMLKYIKFVTVDIKVLNSGILKCSYHIIININSKLINTSIDVKDLIRVNWQYNLTIIFLLIKMFF